VTYTIHGQVVDRCGFNRQVDLHGRSKAWVNLPQEFRRRQSRSTVNVGHDRGWVVGRLLDLSRCESGLWAVCEIDRTPPILFGSAPVYLSAETTASRDGVDHRDIELTGLGLVTSTASVSLSPVDVYDGDLACRGSWHVPTHVRARLDRAAEQRRGTGQLLITDPLPKIERAGGITLVDGAPIGPLRYGPPGRVLAVR